MTQLGKEVQKEMIDLKIGDYLQKESLNELLSLMEGICDRKYANELILEVKKDVGAYAKNFELNFQGDDDSEYEDIPFTLLNETPEYLKKNSNKIFTPWNKESHEIFAKSLKNYLYPRSDSEIQNDLITEDQNMYQPDFYEPIIQISNMDVKEM
jgi:hypothetical protein